MTGERSTKILNLAAMKPLKNEIDTLIRNPDATFISVRDALLIKNSF